MIYALVFWSFVAFGVAYVVGHSKISLAWRNPLMVARIGAKSPGSRALAGVVLTLIECPACLGFWEGLVGYHLGQRWLVPPDLVLPAASFAFFTLVTNLILARVTGLLEEDNDE